MHRYGLAFLIVASPFSAFAAELPKEGSYDFTFCCSGVNNVITFSKTHTAFSYEMTGTNRSNPPGGMFESQLRGKEPKKAKTSLDKGPSETRNRNLGR
jgi:hypothetical protein